MTDKDLQMQRKKSDGTFDKYYPKTKAHLVVDDTTGQTIKEQYNNIVTTKANLVDNKVPTSELPLASQIEAEAGVSDSTLMTPLKVRQFIVSNGGSGGGVTNIVFQCGKKYWKYTASQATNTIVIPTEQFNPISDVLEIVDDNNLILLKDINYVISNNTFTLAGWQLVNGESLHFLITQTSYDYNSLMNKPEVVNDYSGGTNKIASAESVKQLFQLASDGKANIATEINTKGVVATAAETFSSLANKIKAYLTKIEGTAVAGDVLSGKTFKNNTGNLGIGSIPSKSPATITPSTTNQTIAAGQYLEGVQTILGDPDLVAENIKSGVNVFGIMGTFDNKIKRVTQFSGSNSYVLSPAIVPANTIIMHMPKPGIARNYMTVSYTASSITITGNTYVHSVVHLMEFVPGVIKSKQTITGINTVNINPVVPEKTIVLPLETGSYDSQPDPYFGKVTSATTVSLDTGWNSVGAKFEVIEFY